MTCKSHVSSLPANMLPSPAFSESNAFTTNFKSRKRTETAESMDRSSACRILLRRSQSNATITLLRVTFKWFSAAARRQL